MCHAPGILGAPNPSLPALGVHSEIAGLHEDEKRMKNCINSYRETGCR